ncbi:hypothetical protein AJ88_18635 [Mesorhizobium amorphae CCBAU 01583]|nr:hypothetical protein AJ88_18635 [Mesorhizobium amorphae CCBAU 01583]
MTIKAQRRRQGKLRLPAPASLPRDPLPKARRELMPPVPGSSCRDVKQETNETRNEKEDRRMT